ncbi:O-antigen polysaccharide polymerase Wzy [Clostridium vincentii]|uniref:O-antigen polysaccharide polymerase Wzy n=1 Tax=Clostridium vincentii TaxID=52704 RepID=A0A2T0BJL2_9CLOT|nr:O-antigen polysaccharide polymerase Wzy [Clostridium vincentii]PRR84085.1 hypothetical protein CLVI_03830 [Clostridium vincentii]
MENRKSTISSKKLIALMTYLVISTLLIIKINTTNIDTITYLSLIQLVINIMIMKLFGFNVFSLPVLFVIFSYIFHCGQLPLITFNIEADRPFDVINLVGNSLFIKSIWFFMSSQVFLVTGIMLSNIKKVKNIDRNQLPASNQKTVAYRIGITLLIIGIIPRLYIDIKQFSLYLAGTYLDVYDIGVAGITDVIAYCAQIGVLMIIIGKQDRPKFCRKVLILTLIYEIFTMIKGGRGTQVTYILALIFIYMNLVEKIKLKSLVTSLAFSYVGLVFINFISATRNLTNKSVKIMWNSFLDLFIQSPLFNALGEFGGTMISLAYSVSFMPSYTNFNYGKTYILSLLAVIPNVGGILEPARNSWIFVKNFPPGYSSSLGGSYLGELYFNFGNYGIIFSLLVGILIGVTTFRIESSIREKNWIRLSIYMILFPIMLLWTRGYFSDMVRRFAWIGLLIRVLNYGYRKEQGKE